MLYVLYLDDYHAGDPLFLQSLARALGRRQSLRFILVHGSGEYAQRALESEGIFLERLAGLLPVKTPHEHAVVERAIREANRRLTGILTDAVVPCVGILGSERRLLVMDGAKLKINGLAWLESITATGVVPVIAAYASEAGTRRTGEVNLGLATSVLVRSLSDSVTVVAFTKTNLPGIMKGASPLREIPVERVDSDTTADLPALTDLVLQNIPVLLTNTTRLVDSNGPVGTLLRPST